MKINSILTGFAHNLRRLPRIAWPALVGAVILCCGNNAYAQLPGNGFTVFSWGTTNDLNGINIGSTSDRSCFLSGVSGNLDMGAQQGFDCGVNGQESLARVSPKLGGTDYFLVAHGGVCENQFGQPVADNNPVNAEATCFLTNAGVQEGGTPAFGDPSVPVKLAELSTGNTNVRQCFLSGLFGVAGSWGSSSTFARVRMVTAADSLHPTTGWYIDTNLKAANDGSHPRVEGRCVDFPPTTHFTSGIIGKWRQTTTVTITSGKGVVKACALEMIEGAFNVNSWSDGVVMNFPSQVDGDWSITLTAGKAAIWVCAQ